MATATLSRTIPYIYDIHVHYHSRLVMLVSNQNRPLLDYEGRTCLWSKRTLANERSPVLLSFPFVPMLIALS